MHRLFSQGFGYPPLRRASSAIAGAFPTNGTLFFLALLLCTTTAACQGQSARVSRWSSSSRGRGNNNNNNNLLQQQSVVGALRGVQDRVHTYLETGHVWRLDTSECFRV